MTIFKETVEEEYLTLAETKVILEDLERERAADEDREMRYELLQDLLGLGDGQELLVQLVLEDRHS